MMAGGTLSRILRWVGIYAAAAVCWIITRRLLMAMLVSWCWGVSSDAAMVGKAPARRCTVGARSA